MHMAEKIKIAGQNRSVTKIKIFSVVSIAFLILAITFCAVVIIQTTTLGYVNLFGYSLFRIATPSMEPSLRVNTFIISQATDIENLAEGDVVSFISTESYMNGRIVTHRVVSIKEVEGKTCLITRGDANNSIDAAYVTSDNLVGKMVFHTKPDGFFSNAYTFITNKQVFFIVVIAPMLLVAGILMKNGIQKLHEQIDQLKKEIQNDSEDDN